MRGVTITSRLPVRTVTSVEVGEVGERLDGDLLLLLLLGRDRLADLADRDVGRVAGVEAALGR